jgi:deoxyribodipyrimidine photo-lyase
MRPVKDARRIVLVKAAIHWFRRDLRITDNTALNACAAAAEKVVPVYILSDWQAPHCWTGSHRQEFLCGCLEALQGNLASLGGRLILRRGDAVEELVRLVRETGAGAVYFNRDPDPFGRAVEQRLEREAEGFAVLGFKDVCLHERDEVLTGAGAPFRVFTPYAKAWWKLPKLAPSGKLGSLSTLAGVPSLDLPALATWGLEKDGAIIEPGEKAARARLSAFLARGLPEYGARRDFPSEAGTSRISQDLRFGLLSIREVVSRCRRPAEELPAGPRSHAGKFLTELIWREFYMQLLWHFPGVLDQEFQPKFRGMAWPGREADFARWTAGETGFPFVDAAMRELKATGFMPNRARMITAMFLTKDLHLDWRLGERYFLQQLTDGEIASNNGGWQWSAGTGADAAPYFRIQNPWTQTRRYDPEGKYIRKWVPELRDVPVELFFAPPVTGRLARTYPTPIVDHAVAREKTLALFSKQKGVFRCLPF